MNGIIAIITYLGSTVRFQLHKLGHKLLMESGSLKVSGTNLDKSA
jgi:hypothetical protein